MPTKRAPWVHDTPYVRRDVCKAKVVTNGTPAGCPGFAEWNVHADARCPVNNLTPTSGVPFRLTIAL
jgi:hypothetical protein